ncbi:tetraether lipid synthase Tes [Sulfuracidifex tepidarius]|uniref:7,8-dihydro-6-hydroxymethylpterin dimethyltransferase n=1 Tax=Sulfuracidifex tepidarius TaxID=1294262 RepID=A0A510DWD3_9CREN|nr:radical SAM protein [Sulfuracidifex tepidarius]BBG24494.1 7,8-dihydro-6-hydroxymethylpterin dimethyltransferase [Sulfuracidifex tepidarius]BBG27252.1 7,8-dihydro-6-hydroxymethylpterin dimethyltransferase [Sulfuracidifex tepidarius]
MAQTTAENNEKFRLLPAPSSFDEGSVKFGDREIKIGGPLPKLSSNEKLVRVTHSLCPACYRLLPATIFEKENKLYIRKICPDHGEFEDLYYGDVGMYYKFDYWEYEGKGPKVPYVDLKAPCPYNCGLCPMHHQHSALVNLVITNRCDQSCWYCFFYAEKAGYVYEPTLDQISYQIDQLKKQGITLVIQVTGGEPTLREDILEVLKILREKGVRHVQLNTWGGTFAKMYMDDPDKAITYAKQLREAGVNTIYMSFDGTNRKTNPKNHWEIPYTFEVFRKAGMTSVVLVPTVIKTVNDNDLGNIVKFAAKNLDIVRAVNFQPVSLTGMMKRNMRAKFRITIPEVLRDIEEQTDGEVTRDSWYPIGTSVVFSRIVEALTGKEQFEMANHPSCGAGTYIYVEWKGGEPHFIPISKFIDLEGLLEYLKEKSEEIREGSNKAWVGMKALLNIRKFIDKEKGPKDFDVYKMLYNVVINHNYEALGEWHYRTLFLGTMHFMDLYNYDVQRVMRCDIHYASPDGRVIPFCTYNVLNDLYRDKVLRDYQIPLDEWIKVHGSNSLGESVKYKRKATTLEQGDLYKITYKGFVDSIS